MTLKSCDFLVNMSRRHESEDKNVRHTGSASVLHVQHGKIQLCNGMVSFVCACSAMHDMIKTHDLCPGELKQYTRYIPHEAIAPLINLGGSD